LAAIHAKRVTIQPKVRLLSLSPILCHLPTSWRPWNESLTSDASFPSFFFFFSFLRIFNLLEGSEERGLKQ